MNKAIYHILIPIVLALLMNGFIYMFQINKMEDIGKKGEIYKKMLPPGYIIGTIWIVIFGLLGYTHYLIMEQNNNKMTFTSLFIIFVILYSLAYPLLTNLRVKSGLLLNLIALMLAFILGILVIKQSLYAFMFVVPLIVWASYVNIADTIQCSELY